VSEQRRNTYFGKPFSLYKKYLPPSLQISKQYTDFTSCSEMYQKVVCYCEGRKCVVLQEKNISYLTGNREMQIVLERKIHFV